MWTREQVKNNGRSLIHISYWKTVLAALIIAITGGGAGVLGIGEKITAKFPENSQSIQYYGPDGRFFERSFSFPGNITAPIRSFLREIFTYRFPGMLIIFVIFFIIAVASMAFGLIIRFFVFAPLEVGSRRYFVLNHYMSGKAGLDNIVYTFSNGYINVVKTMFFRGLYVFLWSLLLVVPGIIKAYSYRMVPYILADEPGMDMKEAFRLSEYMMEGEKWNAFVLDLSFIGWDILNALTVGILGLFYLNPYKECTYTELYAILKTKVVPA